MENPSTLPDTKVVTDLLQIFFVCVHISSRHYFVLALIKFLSYGERYEFDMHKTESIKLIAFHSNTYFLSNPFRIPLYFCSYKFLLSGTPLFQFRVPEGKPTPIRFTNVSLFAFVRQCFGILTTLTEVSLLLLSSSKEMPR
jgi:hypothetical protein